MTGSAVTMAIGPTPTAPQMLPGAILKIVMILTIHGRALAMRSAVTAPDIVLLPMTSASTEEDYKPQ